MPQKLLFTSFCHKVNFTLCICLLCRYLSGHIHAIMCIYITTNDKYLITGSRDCTIKAWNLATGEVIASFFCASQIKHFAVSEIQDGFYRVVAANKTGMVAIFDLCLNKNEVQEEDAVERYEVCTTHYHEFVFFPINVN